MKPNIESITLFLHENCEICCSDLRELFEKASKYLDRRGVPHYIEEDNEFQQIFVNYKLPLLRVDIKKDVPKYYEGPKQISDFYDYLLKSKYNAN